MTENRKLALIIADAGLSAIDTESVILNSIKLQDNILSILGQNFDLAQFNRIKVVGFGKSSCEAALTLEKILGYKIKEGVVIGLSKVLCENIETFAGTHPRSSTQNLEAGKKIYEMAKNSDENDLIIALVSGGGSALLCYPQSECEQSISMYNEFLKCGKTRIEMNTVWKHLSLLKGGGLAKVAYPATVIGLIFSDVPGDNFENVASGPTYKDVTTTGDAQKIITENNLGNFKLTETPKEDRYFEKVHNFVLVSNKTAVEAMARKGEELHFQTKIVSTEVYDEVSAALGKIFSNKEKGSLVLAAGEPSLEVKGGGGKGGRNLHMGLEAIKMKLIDDNSIFLSLASDGMDNSDVAGALVDNITLQKTKELGLDVDDYAKRFDSYNFFQKVDGLVMTGPTGANVSDLMILLTRK